jgi:methyl-accepting chemotaxis protein PixJ
MTGIYDLRLVALSIVLATVASYTALTLAFQVTVSRKRLCRLVWLIGGANRYGNRHLVDALCRDARLVLTRINNLRCANRTNVGVRCCHCLRSSTVLGKPLKAAEFLPIALGKQFHGVSDRSMHYLGMAALRVQATLQYNRVWWFCPSLLLSQSHLLPCG